VIFEKKKTIHFHTFLPDYMDSGQWIEKTKPDWFAGLMRERKLFKPTFEMPDNMKADACPSFVHLFKNSYTLKTICDLFIRPIDDYQFEYRVPTDLFKIDTHVIQNQMSDEFPAHKRNMKIILPVKFHSETAMPLVFLPSEYETKQTPFTAMTGVLPMTPKINNQMNTNLWVDFNTFEETFIPKGTPYAYMYFPFGRPEIRMHKKNGFDDFNENVSTTKLSFQFDWFKKEK
jgi:hypothetical protein